MTFSNQEGYLFFAWVCIVELWGFAATALVDEKQRYIPIAIMGGCLAVAFIYLMTKVNDIQTLDEKRFKQANLLFYIGCLATAVENKRQWRNAVRGIDAISTASADVIGPEFLAELQTCGQWRKSLNEFKSQAGFLAFFDHAAKSPVKDTKVISAEIATDLPPPAELASKLEFVRDENDKDFIDKWLELVEMTRIEMQLDSKFWAFLNGYCNLKMN
jgi:hypothetical protein